MQEYSQKYPHNIPTKSQHYHCIFFLIDLIEPDLNKNRETPKKFTLIANIAKKSSQTPLAHKDQKQPNQN